MADEVLDGADVILQLLGERESLPDQTGYPLSHCAIETLYAEIPQLSFQAEGNGV